MFVGNIYFVFEIQGKTNNFAQKNIYSYIQRVWQEILAYGMLMLSTFVVIFWILFETRARGVTHLQVIHTRHMHVQTVNACHLEANKILKYIGCSIGIAAKVIAIHCGEEFALGKGNGKLELLIKNERKTAMALLLSKSVKL